MKCLPALLCVVTIPAFGQGPTIPYPVCSPEAVPLGALAAFDHVGTSLAASGSYVLVGVSDADGPGFESGALRILLRDGADWTELPEVVASDASAGALFGCSVAVHDDVALVGARGAASERGAAYVLRRQLDGTWTEEAKLTAEDGVAGDWFGSRVAIEGDVAAVSALHADAQGVESGAVYVFRRGETGWQQEQKLVGLDSAGGDQFGKGLALSAGRVVIGAYGDNGVGQDSGSAYVFRDQGGVWVQEAKLVASDASAQALFGNEVALEGDAALIAARSANGVGAAYVFRRSGTTWTEEQKLQAAVPSAGAQFGISVALADGRALIGSQLEDSVGSNAGAAYLFEQFGGLWVETAKHTSPSAAANDHFGSSVALGGSSYALVGAEWADDQTLDGGELWAFPLPGSCVPQITSVEPTSAQFPGAVTAGGVLLAQIDAVLIDGVPATLIQATDQAIVFQPQPGTPGFASLEATGPDGSADAVQQLFPSIEVSSTGVGGAVHVTLENGQPGFFVLACATGTFPSPIPIASPPTWYGLLLNVTGPTFTLASGAFGPDGAKQLALPIDDKGLAGLTLHFQAWCQQGFGAGVTYSFTNAPSVTL